MEDCLKEIENKVIRGLGNGFERYLGATEEMMPDLKTAAREIHRMVSASHSFHTAYLKSDEAEKRCKDEAYAAALVKEVADLYKLYRFAGPYFPKEPIAGKARYLYYPTAFILFVMCRKSLGLIGKCAGAEGYLFLNIITKSMAVLTLMGTGLLGTAYPMLSEILEQYLNLLIILRYPEVADRFATFVNWNLILGSGNEEEEAAFQKNFREAVAVYPELTRDMFLRFGYVKEIPGFSEIPKEERFTVNGLFRLLSRDALPEISDKLAEIGSLLTVANAYTHGSVLNSRFSFLHYLEIMAVLSEAVGDVYGMICDNAGTPTEIDQVDIYEILDRTTSEISEFLSNKTEESLENADEKSCAKSL